ncbi:hypothetical protein L1049_000902 [Liquidambar formosana]|uniref:Transcription factor MYB80 n=1 Tax=Liquidambar formosana TaxID=63359 RepID=A0AAP0N9L6_LIQFO
MGRIPCCEKDNVKRGQWTPEEDNKLSSYIAQHGTRNWRLIPKNAGLCPPSPSLSLGYCLKMQLLKWTSSFSLQYKVFSDAERVVGYGGLTTSGLTSNMANSRIQKSKPLSSFIQSLATDLYFINGHHRWSLIAAQLPGRTDNDVKNHWNTKLKKKLSGMGIDPVTHKPFSHLMAEIATTLAPPQVAHLAEAALGCFKDEMLHLLTKKRIDFQLQQSGAPPGNIQHTYITSKHEEKDDTIEKIKLGLSRAIQEPEMIPPNKPWDSTGATSANFAGACSSFPASVSGFQYGQSSFANDGDGSPWSQSMCTGSTCTAGDQQGRLLEKLEDENGQDSEGGKELRNGSSIFNSDCVLWDLPSDDLMNPIV